MANHHLRRGEPSPGLFATVVERATPVRVRTPSKIRVPARFHGKQIEIDLKPVQPKRVRRLAQTEDRLYANWLATVHR